MLNAPVVLQVLPSLVTGGVERGTIEIAEAIARAGGTALVASAGGRLVSAVEDAGGRHVTLPLRAKDPLTVWRNAGRLARLIRAEGVEIVHARSRAPAWSALAAARRTGARFLTTYHGAYGEGFPGKCLYNSVMARGERVIAISRYIADLIAARHGIDPARIRVIPRGVDPVRFDPGAVPGERIARLRKTWGVPDGMRAIVLPGRLTRWKGQTVLLEALARLGRTDLCCVLVGSGAGRPGYEDELRRTAARLGLADRLRMPGECDDMPAALLLADVVVHASVEPEAFGRVVIEAQAMARPVIASDGGGPTETVQEGVTGWRVAPGDAGALARVLDHALGLPPDEAAALGRRARAAVQAGYTTAAMQRATLGVYRELLG
ncbi:MAG: glycosyltransferase family 4 protein [Acetobacteraceae bacterium]|nr:glycosyltransferase family 4 protein [Acetobacteraceae bacterium]